MPPRKRKQGAESWRKKRLCKKIVLEKKKNKEKRSSTPEEVKNLSQKTVFGLLFWQKTTGQTIFTSRAPPGGGGGWKRERI